MEIIKNANIKLRTDGIRVFILIQLGALIFGAVFRYLTGYNSTAIVLTCFIVPTLFAYLFLKKEEVQKATHTLLITANFLMSFTSLTLGLHSGIYLFYFPLVIGYSFFLGVNKKRELYLYFLLTAILLFLTLFYSDSFKFFNPVIDTNARFQFIIFAILAFLCLIIEMWLFMKSIENSKNQLLEYIKKLQDAEGKHLQDIKDKEVLLAEVYHRVKNNLAVVSSLINLQINTLEEESAKSALTDCKSRVNSMAMIHQKFYEGKEYSNINFKNYIEDLIKELKSVYNPKNKKIDVFSHLDSNLNFNLSTAIPCGILLNELISNSFKHAFTFQENGIIEIKLESQNDLFLLEVKDNGQGFDYQKAAEKSSSLGIILIQALSEQLNGNFQFFTHNGTTFRLLFSNYK